MSVPAVLTGGSATQGLTVRSRRPRARSARRSSAWSCPWWSRRRAAPSANTSPSGEQLLPMTPPDATRRGTAAAYHRAAGRGRASRSAARLPGEAPRRDDHPGEPQASRSSTSDHVERRGQERGLHPSAKCFTGKIFADPLHQAGASSPDRDEDAGEEQQRQDRGVDHRRRRRRRSGSRRSPPAPARQKLAAPTTA